MPISAEEKALPVYDRVAYLLARRMAGTEIAKRIGIEVKEVYKFGRSPEGRRQVAELRLELLQGVKDDFVKASKLALDALMDILRSKKGKLCLRVEVAKALIAGKDIVQAEEAAAILASAAREEERKQHRTDLEELPDEILVEIARFRVRQHNGLVASNGGNGCALEAGPPALDAPAERPEADQ